jgi:hypothetical protein
MKHHVLYGAILTMVMSMFSNATMLTVPERYQTIGWAISNASSGDTISVLPGTPARPRTYSENINLATLTILIAAREQGWVDTSDIDDPDPRATIIDGNDNGTTVKIPDINQWPNGVVAELRGFTVQNGMGEYGYDPHFPYHFFG